MSLKGFEGAREAVRFIIHCLRTGEREGVVAIAKRALFRKYLAHEGGLLDVAGR